MMAPKNTPGSGAKLAGKNRNRNGRTEEQPAKDEKGTKDTEFTANGSSRKRKAQDDTTKRPSKASRRSSRSGPVAPVDPLKLINYLLSPDSLPLCSPRDEFSDIESRGQAIRTYTTNPFTPFEELVCALVLSRPIGHMLGLRSIRTLFNDPHNLSTPRAIKNAGKDGCRAVLDEARTQHRQKTAEELVLLADAATAFLGDGEDDQSLEKLREACEHDAEKERNMLKKHVKGMAKTGTDIFGRRIQGAWEEWYPFADDRTLKAIENLGLTGGAEGLVKTIAENWGEIQKQDILGKDEKEKKRNVFVMLLERAVGAELEGNTAEVKSAIA